MFNKDKKSKRFEIKEDQGIGLSGSLMVVVDTMTGVNYALLHGGNGLENMIPLLDSDGNILVDKKNPEL
jgi:hypothetical protein